MSNVNNSKGKRGAAIFVGFFRPVTIASLLSFLITLVIDILLVAEVGIIVPAVKSALIISFAIALWMRNSLSARLKEIFLIVISVSVVINLLILPVGRLFSGRGLLLWVYRTVLSANFFIIAAGGIVRIYTDGSKALMKNSISGLGNRLWMADEVNRRIESGTGRGTLLLADVRNFRIINSIFGRSFGDSLIRTFAEMLKGYRKDTVIVGHLGGIEFCIWTEDTDRDRIRKRIGDFESVLRQRISEEGEAVDVMLKTSAAVYPEDGINFSELLASANIAMEQTMLNLQLSHVYYSPDMKRDMTTESIYSYELRKAVENAEFYVCYQKKCSLDGMRVAGLEALARWKSGVFGDVSPAIFVPLIHKAGLTDAFTEIILGKVLGELPGIVEIYGRDLRVAVNIAPSSFVRSGFVDYVKDVILKSGADPEMLTFEITEDIFVEEIDGIYRTIDDLREFGIRISLDDFGTGYSSLSYLQNLPVHEVKIDKSFIERIDRNEKDYILVKAICEIAGANEYTVVAEGVETREQLERLMGTACDLVQGFLYSRPETLERHYMPFEKITPN